MWNGHFCLSLFLEQIFQLWFYAFCFFSHQCALGPLDSVFLSVTDTVISLCIVLPSQNSDS